MDGATGTELTRRGIDTSLPLWSATALLDAPDTLRQIHADYRAAGAELITTNTFRTHRRSLQGGGFGERAGELTRLAVEIARQAARLPSPNGAEGLVAGSIAPLEDCYSPELVPADEMLRAEHEEMVAHLVDAGVDILLVETMNTVREAVVAAGAAVASELPTFVGLICDRDGKLLSGESVREAVEQLEPLGPDALSINCTPTPELHKALGELISHTDLAVGAYGNVGYADDDQGWVNTDSIDPEAYVRHAERWLQMGARLIGGCCGTGPAHTTALANLMEQAA